MQTAKKRVKNKQKFSLKKALLGIVALGVLGFVGKAYRDSGFDVDEFIARTIGAEVEHIMVEGAMHVAPEDLREAIALAKGDSLVGFDAAKTRDSLERLDWIRVATVERKLPATVKVGLYEYVPLARIMVNGQSWVMDKEGHLITPIDDEFQELPKVSGIGGQEQAAMLFALLAQGAKLSDKVMEATFVGERRWNLLFSGGVSVKLPEENIAQALAILAKLDDKRDVLAVAGTVVDLRLSDRVVLRVPPGKVIKPAKGADI